MLDRDGDPRPRHQPGQYRADGRLQRLSQSRPLRQDRLTVDVASHRRLYAGIGAGWYEQEWKAYGYEWTDTPTRMRRFREAVQIIHQMWTEDYPAFHGQHYTIDRPINEPKECRPGHTIPFWIGGGGEQVTLKLVAQYGDACNFAAGQRDDPAQAGRAARPLREGRPELRRDHQVRARSGST